MTSPDVPSPPATSPAVLLVALGRQLDGWINGSLEEVGLSLRLLGALGHLAREPGLSYTELARRARVTTQSMHATVAALIEAGAVAPAGPGRGRRALLDLTPRGRRLLATGQAVIAGIDAELRGLGSLPADRDLFGLLGAVTGRTGGPSEAGRADEGSA
ncbi:MarR family winged helix-turn-helix transcriptional regulator [Blastococcus xanthinilyticus]|uniref:DNA-binding MarR family transcriptional regulator n=1 Tax=Blastococcus xanthinilyticus TaxID=1564164 RepID=A0A5S5D171_9ACTN|nr:MarR family winged helix-turn-helix transcriptional regulator [Blastococcus xanthinilyticus]TYP89094.1 DNA-binding MarR family transcriptional regulator [Blastococcus xanthinilyticus]